MNASTLDGLQFLLDTEPDESLPGRLRRWFYRTGDAVRRAPRVIAAGIKNIFYWLPVIWSDRQWDHLFFYLILRHKLHRMEGFFRVHAQSIGAEKDAENIRRAKLVLDRLITYDYWQTAKNYRHEEYLIEQDLDYLFTIFRHEEYLIEQDLDYLFTILRKHIRYWWD